MVGRAAVPIIDQRERVIALLSVVRARELEKQQQSNLGSFEHDTGTDTARICGDNSGGTFSAVLAISS